MKLKHFTSFLFLLLLLGTVAGCKSVGQSLPPVTEDTDKQITITEKVHDTVFVTQKDSSFYKAYIECVNGRPEIVNPQKRTGHTILTPPNVQIKGNTLNVDCYAKAQELLAQWKSKEVDRITKKTIKVPIPVEKQNTNWEKFYMFLGRISFWVLILLLVMGLLRFRKII